MTNAILRGKPDAGNPHVRFDEGEVASAKPRRGSLLYTKWSSAGEKEECNQQGDRWTTDTVVIPASIDGHPFEVEFGDEKKNAMFQMAVDKDAVIGYDFFKSFIVLLNRREMQLSFKPAGK